MKNVIFFSLILLTIISCTEKEIQAPSTKTVSHLNYSDKIQVLNFGTFHFGFTSDATKTEFDEHSNENIKQVHEVAKKIALFKPTVILVEREPEYNDELLASYNSYVKNPKMKFENPSEIELLAFEAGRLSGTKRIYGIDHQMSYNYGIGFEMKNNIDSVWHNKFYENPLSFYPEVNLDMDSLNLFDKLKLFNHDQFLNFVIATNADMLTHVGSDTAFEGADEASKYYQRNLRMYSNLNRIELNENDNVFILMGASHTASFRDFLGRSPKYKMVNTFDYLK